MAKLSDALRTASFRGVDFQVETSDMGVGRRNQVHEYPQRDDPYVEDIGRLARELSFDGFVVGSDYIAQANRLLAALEAPGSATLVHPWFGTLTVNIKDPARVSFNASLGQARFTMSFVESGALSLPSAASSTQAQSRLLAAKVETSALADFSKRFSIAGAQDFVSAQAATQLRAIYSAVGGGSIPGLQDLGYASAAVDNLKSALTLLSNPSALGAQVIGLLSISSLTGVDLPWSGLARSLVQLVDDVRLAPPVAPVAYTPSRQQAYVNTDAINALTRQVLLAQAVGASSLVPATVHEETISLRNELTAALDAESLNASDQAYDALQEARGKVWADLTARASDSARLAVLTPTEPLPALVVAYDYYEDASRDDDIVTRNKIRHPGFVPALPLKVLTR